MHSELAWSDPELQQALLAELGSSASVRRILDVVCETTGMGFAAVAYVTESRWVAAQVRDDIAFGLVPGDELPLESTLCHTVRGTRNSIVIDDVANDPVYRDHHTPAQYGLQSYIAVPIVLAEGDIFGTLCAIDPAPRRLDTRQTRGMFELFAQLIGTHVDQFRLAAEGNAAREANAALSERVAEAQAEKKVYADIIESSNAAVTALDLEGRVLAINRSNVEAFEQVFGKRPVVGEDFLALFQDPAALAQQRAIWSRALTGESFVVVQEFGDPKHERRSYEVRFAPLFGSDGVRIGASSTSYDVTDRVAAERALAATQEQLREAQKMEAMGQLTGGVAHDFNNLLTPIVGSLDMLSRSKGSTEREQRMIAGALQSAERARMLVQRLLAFARRQPLQPRAVDVAVLVRDLVHLITSTIGPQITLEIDLADTLPPAHADPQQLELALLNLSVNARDAMGEGGVLRISAVEDTLQADHPARLRPGSYVRLSVSDTGKGMDEETLARAVEPFFSTKGIGKGTGLGLSMVDGLARQLGGTLALRSSPGSGTRIDLWLPASAGAPQPAAEPAEETAQTGTHAGMILLVDDEDLVRLSTADMLEELGYRVAEAASGHEALAAIGKGLRPDAVITDHLMPGMTGIELAQQLAQECPGVPLLIISGYAEASGIAAEFARLAKPFRKDELAARLEELRKA